MSRPPPGLCQRSLRRAKAPTGPCRRHRPRTSSSPRPPSSRSRPRQSWPRNNTLRQTTAPAAPGRLATVIAEYKQTMTGQAQVVENVAADARALSAIVAKSQGAEGSLQAQQAANQLLALTAKQQFQIQNMMAAQYRAETIERARRAQAEIDARAATTRFLGSGSAYTPR